MDRSSIALVIPAFNEENTIKELVLKAKIFGIVIVIDDFSSDSTKSMAKDASAIVVSHESNMGYDRAIDSGFKKAKEIGCKYIITLDADGQHNPNLLQHFITKLCDGNDLVLGVRDKLPRISEKIFSFYSMKKFGVEDPCCGMKAYSVDIYEKKGYFDSYNSIGTELTFYAIQSGYCFTQIHFKVKDRIDHPRFGNVIKANYKIIKALFKTILRFNI